MVVNQVQPLKQMEIAKGFGTFAQNLVSLASLFEIFLPKHTENDDFSVLVNASILARFLQYRERF